MAAASEVGAVDGLNVVTNVDVLDTSLFVMGRMRPSGQDDLELCHGENKKHNSSCIILEPRSCSRFRCTHHDGVLTDLLDEGVTSAVVGDGETESWTVLVDLKHDEGRVMSVCVTAASELQEPHACQ